uniref:Uncharacterized protein n=1 Tax=Steinernema glaseri TaxID=37863 RepID=A0A1I7ZN08_9BILA
MRLFFWISRTKDSRKPPQELNTKKNKLGFWHKDDWMKGLSYYERREIIHWERRLICEGNIEELRFSRELDELMEASHKVLELQREMEKEEKKKKKWFSFIRR